MLPLKHLRRLERLELLERLEPQGKQVQIVQAVQTVQSVERNSVASIHDCPESRCSLLIRDANDSHRFDPQWSP